MKLKIKNISDNPLPCYKNVGDAGMDICSNEDVKISPFNWKLVSTGIFLEIPEGYEVQVRSRSGLAAKHGIMVLNSPGTIDSGYRGEVKVILKNHDHHSYYVKKGDRIAQLVMAPVVTAEIEEVSELTNTERNEGGFGSTGK
ncbi:MAG: dUTP diphosphatase [Candidatus Pacebacteria bacterium]|jgi:dUTP pyrophosphatase|nr:dUTP diphosphatase [Candidatus Paceibacterota bacterium]|tara:strand:- start:3383 stop:3808 length:426 start_codon:yes stop_codon:yes gene_type:complete